MRPGEEIPACGTFRKCLKTVLRLDPRIVIELGMRDLFENRRRLR